jgi:aminoglycoside phosphotransferase (APT) family kinase protein
LRELDEATRDAIARSGGLIDAGGALAAWERALEAPPFAGAPVWVHADLLPPNLLVRGGRLTAVIDFGSAGVGDPAADVTAAWTLFEEPGRAVFREALGVDDGAWERARGYALTQAALIVPYYARTNPPFTAMAQRTIARIVA